MVNLKAKAKGSSKGTVTDVANGATQYGFALRPELMRLIGGANGQIKTTSIVGAKRIKAPVLPMQTKAMGLWQLM